MSSAHEYDAALRRLPDGRAGRDRAAGSCTAPMRSRPARGRRCAISEALGRADRAVDRVRLRGRLAVAVKSACVHQSRNSFTANRGLNVARAKLEGGAAGTDGSAAPPARASELPSVHHFSCLARACSAPRRRTYTWWDGPRGYPGERVGMRFAGGWTAIDVPHPWLHCTPVARRARWRHELFRVSFRCCANTVGDGRTKRSLHRPNPAPSNVIVVAVVFVGRSPAIRSATAPRCGKSTIGQPRSVATFRNPRSGFTAVG